MRFVDKSKYRDIFNIYVKQYLKDASPTGSFIPDLNDDQTYKNFSDRRYKYTRHKSDSLFNGWLSILLKEQENRCCYCMRYLDNKISVEHVIPENFEGLNKVDEFKYYTDNYPILKESVCLGEDIKVPVSRNDINNLGKFPHLIAHSNLYPACQTSNSSNQVGCSCNNNRGNVRIIPLMLVPNVETFVKYDGLSGKIEITHPDINLTKKTYQALDINTETLKEIRHLWYLCVQEQISLSHTDKHSFKERDAIMRKLLELGTIELIPSPYRTYVEKESYWNMFLQYDWFYTYFAKNTVVNHP